MELCTTRGTLSTPPPLPVSSSHRLLTNSHFRFPLQKIPQIPGAISYKSRSTWLRASSDESWSNSMEKKSDTVATIGDDDVTSSSVMNDVNVKPVNASLNEYYDNKQKAEKSDADDYSSVDEALQPLKDILKELNIELDVEDTPTILLYCGGAVVAVWLLSAIIGAIDSIPVFPKLMEVVGLGYSVWFTSRYLLFKKSREELGSKIEELKQEVLGTSDE